MPEHRTTIKKITEPSKEPVAAPASLAGKKPIPFITIGLLLLAVVIVGAIALWGIPYLFPAPLTLPAGTDLQGRLVMENKLFHIGDLIPVTIEVEYRNGVKYQMPDLGNLPLGQLELKERDSKPTIIRLRGGQIQKTQLRLTCWEVGEHPFPTLTVTYQTAAGKEMTAQIPAKTIVIRSLLPANRSESELMKLDIKGLKGPVSLPPRYEPLWWFGAVLLVGLLLWLLVKYLTKFRGKKESLSSPEAGVSEPAHLIAFRRLAALKNAGYLEQGDFKTYYSELSECVREYMENRFQIRALEMTTEEFLTNLANHKNTRIQFEFQAILREFLNSSDLIKFAKHRPVAEDAETSYELIRDLIEKTKETPAPPEVEGQFLSANERG